MTRAVLDASAVLALLHDEPGASEVEPWIADGVVSAVNLAEVVGELLEAGMPEGPTLTALRGWRSMSLPSMLRWRFAPAPYGH